MPPPLVLVEHRDRIACLTLNRPQARNALSRDLAAALTAAVTEAEADPAVAVILLAAAGPHFCAGADIAEMAALEPADLLADDFSGACPALAVARKPVVAAVQGAALGGGCELVEMCDVVIAADTARFGHPEITLATMPGCGGTQRLMRAVGKAVALDLLLTGRPLTAAEALAAGLVSRVVAADRVADEALAAAAIIAAHAPAAVQRLKQAALAAHELPLAAGLTLERHLFHQGFPSPARRAAMAAFAGRSSPTVTRTTAS
ncbi:enoyl-CoA hydratase-related protein [Caenispirillum bisanense]|uniref:enoyl-CoA hydratase-related protein n=1 Tax=Caenispirillum bisanense TaxID=414052 RepID=UPI0031D3B758